MDFVGWAKARSTRTIFHHERHSAVPTIVIAIDGAAHGGHGALLAAW